MSHWPSIPRRLLLRLAGAGLVASPAAAAAQPGAARPVSASEGAGPGTVGAAPVDPWTVFFAGQRIWAYADRVSFEPGEPLNVMMAAGPGQPSRRVRLEVFRIGAADPTPVWTSDFVDVGYHGATASGAAIGPGWPPALGAIDTRAWPPGCYSADVVEQTTATRDVKAAQWIVKNPKRSGAVLARLGTNTYQAYNPWGGHSLYPNGDDETRGLIVTYDRPTPPAFFEYDVWLVQWLEALAASIGGVDYAANFDIHADPGFMDPYPLVITGSHDEYWSGEEFAAFQRRIFTRGANTAFFGANTAYCQVRYADLNAAPGSVAQGRQIVCFKTSSDPIARRAAADADLLVTSNFRDRARRPETMLLGGAYQSWFETTGPQQPPYLVARTDLPLFDGAGWKVGDTAAPVVGYEWDNRDPDGDGARLWAAGRSHIPPIDPAAIQVLFRGQAIDADGKPGLAEATLYRSPAGAQVFNAGAVRWAWGFTNPPFRRFNENLVRALSRRGG